MKRLLLLVAAILAPAIAYSFTLTDAETDDPWTQTHVDAVVERIDTLEQFQECPGPLLIPTGITTDDDIVGLARARTTTTIDSIWCRTDTGTATINLQRDDGTPANIATSNIVCSTGGESTTTLEAAEDELAAGELINLSITAVSGPPTALVFCWGGTR